MIRLLSFSKKYIFKYKYRFFIGCLLIVISNIFTLLPIPYIGKSINTIKIMFYASYTHKIDIYRYNTHNQLKIQILIYAIIISIIPIIGGVIKYYMRQCIMITSRMIECDIKNEIFAHYQKLNLSFYQNNSTGDLMNRLTEDVSYIRQFLGPAFMYTLNLMILFIMVFIQMFRLNKSLSFYVMIPIPILFIIIYYISKHLFKISQYIQENQAIIASFIQETFSGIHLIKSFFFEKFLYKKYNNMIINYYNQHITLSTINTILSSIIIFFIGNCNILILLFGGKKYFNGDIKEIGVLAEFFTYINIIIFPFFLLNWIVLTIEKAKVSIKRIHQFLQINPNILNKNLIKNNFYGKIQFINVSFIYNTKCVFKKISFTIAQGKTLIVTGQTGSGKTTIGRLMSRLYDPSSGKILIDNILLQNHNLFFFRKNISYLSQEAFLFSDTIYNNIAFGSINQEITPDQVYEAAKNAMIDKEIINFKNGYNTILGERGMTLSVGQRQRICIARAIIRNPKIIILDDIFSGIDYITTKLIINFLQKKMKNTTIVIITNDISYISNFDLLLLLHHGKIYKIT
ncbi:ABC transporter ATP-binding protein [Blattabacterium cuenoti]|uniref:ABC transporter ATP-binding protein n=1 Tax=Blattabacterium cuenoti TaxID=1653831 RepID=UPI00163BC214|nr:ABC transporter ATP-binding protein [Blattabacterium cuenoti]